MSVQQFETVLKLYLKKSHAKMELGQRQKWNDDRQGLGIENNFGSELMVKIADLTSIWIGQEKDCSKVRPYN